MKTKFNLDRKRVPSEVIANRRDFDNVLQNSRVVPRLFHSKPWFYGASALFVLLLALGLWFSYQSDNEPSKKYTPQVTTYAELQHIPSIQPISETADLAYLVYSIDPKRGGNILLQSGTEIRFDRNCFQTRSTSPVEIKVREFRDFTEAFAAGIPMDHGKNETMETAGMIEIRAMQDGENVEIAPGKEMRVSLALYKNPENFSFWHLEEQKAQWKAMDAIFLVEDPEEINREIKRTQFNLGKVDEKKLVCQSELTEIEQRKPDNSLMPQMGSRKLQIDFDEKEFPELRGYKEIEFEYVHYNEEVAKILKSRVWTNVELKKQDDYLAVFTADKIKQSVKVRPVLKGKTLQEVQKQITAAQEEYEKTVTAKAEELEELTKRSLQLKAKLEGLKHDQLQELKRQQNWAANKMENNRKSAQLINAVAVFETNRFGLFNCDKPISYPQKPEVLMAFVDSDGHPLQLSEAYVFDFKQEVRFDFGSNKTHGIEQLAWEDHNKNTILAFDVEGRSFIIRPDKNKMHSQKMNAQYFDLKGISTDDLKRKLKNEAPLS